MKQSLLLLILISCICASAQKKQAGFYKAAPKKFTPVNDFAGLLSKDEIRSLSKKIIRYKDSTGNVLVIITQSNLTDPVTKEVYGIEEAALHYFNKWGIGDKQENNGVLIFLAKADHKVRITTGKGIDDVVSDEDCQQIIDEDIIPNFKTQQYYAGLTAAVDALIDKLSPTAPLTSEEPASLPVVKSYNYLPDETAEPSRAWGAFGLFVFFGTIISIVAYLIRTLRGSDADVYSGVEPFIGGHHRGLFWWFGSGYHHHHNRYNDSSFMNDNSVNSFGSSSFSSDSSGSSDSSSSSGSFGGGSSDGGGASGSW